MPASREEAAPSAPPVAQLVAEVPPADEAVVLPSPDAMSVPVSVAEAILSPATSCAPRAIMPPPPPSQADAEPVAAEEKPASAPVTSAGSADEWVRLAATWQPSSQTWGPLVDSWKESGRKKPAPAAISKPAPAPAPEISSVTVQEELEPAPSEPVEREAERPKARSSAIAVKSYRTEAEPASRPQGQSGLWPLIAFNAVFDTLLFLVWPLRGWLRSRGGRNFLAGLGILCMLAAVALVANDWFGWTR